jgi:hypothetical protein
VDPKMKASLIQSKYNKGYQTEGFKYKEIGGISMGNIE